MADDHNRERQRLTETYAAMMDGELLRIAANLDALTPIAREIISLELAKRGLKPEDENRVEPQPEPPLPAAKAYGVLRTWINKHLAATQREDAFRYGPFGDDVPPPLSTVELAAGSTDDTVLVTAARFLDLPRALVVRGAMSSAEIGCVLCDTELARTDWLWTNLIGWLRLQVHPQDLPEAIAIVHQPIPERFDVPGVGEYEQPACPRCKSLDVNFQENSPFAYGSLFLSCPVPLVRDGWRCHTCRYEWKDEGEAPMGMGAVDPAVTPE